MIEKELSCGAIIIDENKVLAKAEEKYTVDEILEIFSKYAEDPNVEVKVESDKFDGIKGDVNGDSEITIYDPAQIIKCLDSKNFDKLTKQADFDENGVINFRDAAALCKYLADTSSNGNGEKVISEIKVLAARSTETTLSGDANEDGTVNVRDCALIASSIASGKSDSLPNAADYNKDGKKNVRDAAAISKDLANK